MRLARQLIALVFFLLGAFAVVLAFALYLAATGRSVPVLRALASGAGRALAGQETIAASLAVHLQPAGRRLSGTARLTVRMTDDERRRLYFLLNPGLGVRAVWQEGADTRTALGALRFGPLLIVELAAPLAAGEQVRLGIEYAGQPERGPGSAMVLEAEDAVLTPADLWYPADAQGFFLADVEVLLPAALTLAHNGREVSRVLEGTAARVRFTIDRPVPGLALVAGRYAVHEAERDGVRARVLLPAAVQLDPNRLQETLAVTHRRFSEAYGPAGVPRVTLFVARGLGRAFNDGTGLIGVPPRYFADGEYGFPLLAHEVAHTWWGATVSERWLQPGTGGEWIVEGFAELSSWRAVREQLGAAALLRTQARAFFDPDRTVPLIVPSMLDNALNPDVRPTIYNKGAYVAYMLQERLGEAAFDAAARQFIEAFRYRGATAGDLEAVFSTASQQDLAPFFDAWVRGNESLDLVLDPLPDGGAAVRNYRTAPAPDALALWRFPPDSEPEKQTTQLGATTPIGNVERVVLDPLAAVADMFRSNNVLPRRDSPRLVAASARGEIMVVRGEPYAWEPATIEVLPRADMPARSWAIDRGVLADPGWSADGTRILAVESPREGRPSLLALDVTDGSRRSLGRDTVATGAADATIVARGDRLIRVTHAGTTVLAEHPGGRIFAPLASPDGAVAYGVAWETQSMELYVLPAGGAPPRILFTWPTSALRWRWASDGGRLFAALAGDWDWQLWELPLDDAPPRPLVREAALITDLAVAPDGARVAFVAQADIDDPLDRAEVFVIDRQGGETRRFNLGGRTAFSAAWLDEESLAVVVADPSYPSLPIQKELRRLRLGDGSVEPMR